MCALFVHPQWANRSVYIPICGVHALFVPRMEGGAYLWCSDHPAGFPLGLENLENLEKWEGIFQSGKSQGILNRLEKSGKSQGKPHKILEN